MSESKRPRIAVCTTFPNNYYDICAKEMLESFAANWPEDVKIYVQLDEQEPDSFKEINNKVVESVGEDRAFIASLFDEDQKQFIEKYKDHKPKNYMGDVLRFSYKVFALEKCADAVQDVVDYLIWLDADVITTGKVTYEWLDQFLPKGDEICSFLGRDKIYSECGFVAYNIKAGAYNLIKEMKYGYISDGFKSLSGWTDCHVFDECRLKYNSKNLSPDFVYGKSDLNVWAMTKLAEKMDHRKGARKVENKKPKEQKKNKIDVVDVNNLKIKTKNCLDHEKICSNVKTNLSQIRAWATICNPTGEDIIIASAGPSLVNHIAEIRQRVANGAKLVAVKHAIETLKAHKLTPWAVVLLDPRAHVEGFVKEPDTDPFYFVASMCDPSVVETLNKHKCKVIGYHALVNAGELNLMVPADMPVSGGSATSTRSIGLFADMFGYKNFHLYGYDLCHYQKPDLDVKSEDGNPKFIEVNLGATTYGNRYVTRTFWTEGQFIAQASELANLYKERKDINITIYGDGMAGWQYKHHVAFEKFKDEHNRRIAQKRIGTPNLEEYLNAATRGADLARGK